MDCEIGGDHRRPAAGGGDPGGEFFRRRERTMRMDRDRVSRIGKRAHDRAADPLRSSGDESTCCKA